MASLTIRTTYALDRETVDRLDRLAQHWNLSRSAALRKLVREAEMPKKNPPNPQLEALRQLHAISTLTPEKAEAWKREIRRERLASAAKRMPRR